MPRPSSLVRSGLAVLNRFRPGLAAAGALLLLGAAGAGPARAEGCQGPIARAPLARPGLDAGPAAPDGTPIRRVALASSEVRITFIGHATFTIESPGGIVAATDYNDYVRPARLPDIATMNHAHSTHFTHRPDPAIRHVLRGWRHEGRSPAFDIREGDMRVRNVATNIRADGAATEFSGNSIFIFEVAGLCIAHLGHLHHTLRPEHLAALGQIDVLLAAVDGSWTIDLDGMMEIIGQIRPKLVIPMHYLGEGALRRFLARAEGLYPITRGNEDSIVVSMANLPERTAIRVLNAW
ncbi:MAG: MBL fold metallo-hydrolase [Rhabdaerophilum calidifontis]